jgi:hypothetical protein
MSRDLEKDRKRLEDLGGQDYIDDPAELMSIADHAVSAALASEKRALVAEEKADKLIHEMRMIQDDLNQRRWQA